MVLNPSCGRVRATKNAPRNTFRVLKPRYGLAEIVERGGWVPVERLRVIPPHLERKAIVSENASRHWNRFAQQ